MASSAFFAVILTVSVIAMASRVTAQCPNLGRDYGCHTGSCSTPRTHPRAKWNIPTGVPLLTGYGTSAFYLQDTLPDDTSVGHFVKVSQRKNFTSCCRKCKRVKSYTCRYFQFLNLGSYGGLCFIYTNPTTLRCNDSMLVTTRAGAKCQNPNITGDPHLVGAQGTHFDFSGRPGKSYCLLSDSHLHINMKMVGYLDSRTESATVIENGKAVRTWIRELGIMWKVDAWESHSLRLVSRASKKVERGDGFMAFMEYNEEEILPKMEVGSVLVREDGKLSITFVAVEKTGPYEVDYYRIRIGDLVDMDVRLRVAHPLLRTPEDAEAHISVGFNDIKSTPTIHGVLGQTYREGRGRRGVEFQKVADLLHRAVGADSEEGKGFLDGVPEDYVTSSVMSPNCRYSAYQGWATEAVKMA